MKINNGKRILLQYGVGSNPTFPITFATVRTCVGTVNGNWGFVVSINSLTTTQVIFNQWQTAAGGSTSYATHYVALGTY